jgi:hypothetical protein
VRRRNVVVARSSGSTYGRVGDQTVLVGSGGTTTARVDLCHDCDDKRQAQKEANDRLAALALIIYGCVVLACVAAVVLFVVASALGTTALMVLLFLVVLPVVALTAALPFYVRSRRQPPED